MNFFETNNKKKPFVLVILDGLGIAPPDPGNAVSLAHTEFLDKLWPQSTHGQLYASGTEVGLPYGVPGNSEICHLNIGTGRIILNDLSKIDKSIQNGDWFNNPTLMKAINHAKDNNTNIHLIGLVGNGYVHSSVNHFKAMIKMISQQNVSSDNVFVHAFTDGRDSSPWGAKEALDKLSESISMYNTGKIVSLLGRYYAMDRDHRWDRTKIAYDLLHKGIGEKFLHYDDALQSSYKNNITDEFVKPIVLDGFKPIKANDSVIIMNFRSDRIQQLCQALENRDFSEFEKDIHQEIFSTTMANDFHGIIDQVVFPHSHDDEKHTLAQILSINNMEQLHIAESEKFPHVTYFFNGQREEPYPGEVHVEIPSPRDVPTYDKKPEMSAYELTDRIIEELNKDKYDFILINYANPDMVGHTGVLDAGIRAIEVVDECLSKIVPAILDKGGKVIITADHGNVEEMINRVTGEVDTQHSINNVPILMLGEGFDKNREIRMGRISDIAPTILQIMGLPIPQEMTGRFLLD